ncbi:hypothetical protein [Asticcacaulis sp. EMRT-3]|uniref:hypothetical protein n=1 Tax=Asticcacaulis sp. EMRT-3 TaxID=3040349 RepID=UPI0024AEB361|nr:hypothetical protein [Asticcacaulis sp. EMRT-3]MDI7774684.1 hypothetical protein [Asticcacaulis sp. EMRT-3]
MDDKERYRQLRGAWGWIFLGAWMVLWWMKLSADRAHALTLPCPENFMNSAQDLLLGKGSACKAGIDAAFWGGLFMALIFSPLGFVASHYFAKWRIEQAASEEERAAHQQEQARQQANAAAMAEMGARSKSEEQSNRVSNDRFELITRIGAVDDQLVVLADEADPKRIKLIKLNLMQALRDIHAKFRDEELRAMHASDSGIASRVTRTLAEMRKLNLEGSRLYDDLASMFLAEDDDQPSADGAVTN